MRKYFFSLLIILLFSVGCKRISDQTNTPSQQIFSQPLLTRWEIEGNPAITQSGFTYVINGFYLINQEILIFYALTGSTADILTSENDIQILDDTGVASNLIEITVFTNIDGIEIGKMLFMPRRTGIHALYLTITNRMNPKINQKVLVAELIGSTNDDHLDRVFYGEPLDISELNGFQISIIWSAPPGNQAGGDSSETPTANNTQAIIYQPTPTMVVRRPIITIPPNVYSIVELTFQVKNINTGYIQYLGIQLLSDGSSVISSNGEAILATPIVLTTPTPVNILYPPPTSPYP
jgi:hypothetical protein